MVKPVITAFVSDAPRIAGSEIWLLEVLPRLATCGVDSTLFLPDLENLNDFVERIKQRGINVRRFADISELPSLTQDFDLRVLQGRFPNIYQQVLPKLAKPNAVLIHDQMQYHYPFGLEAFYRWGFGMTKARYLGHTDRVITVSRWSANYMRQSYGIQRLVSIHNGVDLDRFHPAVQGEREKLREQFAFTGFVVVYAARLALEKNHWALLQTAKQTPEMRYILVGEGELKPFLTRFAPPNVEFWGKRWDVPEIYRAADASLQPTLAENQSLSTLEAMACGLPVVTTDIPAQAEIITHGLDGFLLPAKATLFAKALRQLQQDIALARQIGNAAQAKIAQKHTIQQTATAFFAALSTTGKDS